MQYTSSTDAHFTAVVVALALLALVNVAEFRCFAEVFSEARRPERGGAALHTRIRGVWYDLSGFDHPGGPVALRLSEGRDGTALFESHHYLIPTKRLHAILEKYRANAALQTTLETLDSRDDGAHYVWDKYEDDPFTVDVKNMVVAHFTPMATTRGISLRAATKATPVRWAMIVAMMVAFASTLPAFLRGDWWTLLVTPQVTISSRPPALPQGITLWPIFSTV